MCSLLTFDGNTSLFRNDSNAILLCIHLHCFLPIFSIIKLPVYLFLGVILKMARLISEGAPCFEGDSVQQAARKPPIRTYVIQGKDFVQIIARVRCMMFFEELSSICTLRCFHVSILDSVLSISIHLYYFTHVYMSVCVDSNQASFYALSFCAFMCLLR
jgi:hypothetical protein